MSIRALSSSATTTALDKKGGSTTRTSSSRNPSSLFFSSKPKHPFFYLSTPITLAVPPLMKPSLTRSSQRPKPVKQQQEEDVTTTTTTTLQEEEEDEHKLSSILLCTAAGVGVAAVVLASGGTCAFASELGVVESVSSSSLQFNEPQNALSLPTWAIHVSSVAEWVTAMILVWRYGDKPGYESWKGLSWGMVPLLGGAFCACTWHFFYNSDSLNVLVVIQAALTVIGNFTMCIAAYRIFKSTKGSSTNL